MTPMPPACAIAMARRPSVTVSIAAETIGRLSRIVRVSRELRSTSPGITAEAPGRNNTSSKARPSFMISFSMVAMISSLARCGNWRRDVPCGSPGA